ncbi:MAG TPA: ribonuclease III [Methylomirabilota bacterium]|nr:ribonuclease III [Methylomirabilota bacterium]
MSASELNSLEEKLGYTFRDPALLRLALTHPSIAHEQEMAVQHNQRLEFLGDAVLGLILTRELYDRFPDFGEGPLTKARAQLVNQHTLAEQSRQLGIGEFLIMSRGELTHGGTERPSSLADAYEAVTGAVFLDGGWNAARDFVLRCFRDSFGEFMALPNLSNPKGELQEMLQSKSNQAPHYEIIAASGPDHDRDFECAVFHEGRELGRGKGKSKRTAESAAALAALLDLKKPRSATQS